MYSIICSTILLFVGRWLAAAVKRTKTAGDKPPPYRISIYYIVGTVRPTFAFGKLAKFALRTSRRSILFNIGRPMVAPTNELYYPTVGTGVLDGPFYLTLDDQWSPLRMNYIILP